MPCNEWEEDQAEDEFPAARRQKKRTKRGAELEESDDEGFGTDEPPDDKSRRKWNGKAEFELVKASNIKFAPFWTHFCSIFF